MIASSPLSRILALLAAFTALAVGEASAQQTWSEQTTAAAMGYCLARHPYIPRNASNPFTSEGFEILASPGVLGAVRRNYIFQRIGPAPGLPDPGQGQNCTQACVQFGLNYGSATGRPLHYRDASGNQIPDGIGDMASLAYRDFDYYNNQNVIAGLWGRPLNYHQSDVAQADFCCCQLDTSAPPPPKEACVDFEVPLIAGTQFGANVGGNPGDTAFTSNGIGLTIEKFAYNNGGAAFNEAMIDNQTVPDASGQSMRVNNISLRFDFSNLAFQPARATVKYLDLGGSENLSANDDAPLIGDLAQLPNASGGTTINITETPVAGGKHGVVEFAGPLKAMLIGGQEFWIDQLCVSP